VLGSFDTNLNNEAGPLLRSLRLSATNVETLSARIDHELPALLDKADSSMESLRTASETINDAVKRSAPQLPVVMGKAQKLIGDTQEAVDSLSTHWPLKSDAPATDTGPVKMDSHD